MPLERFINCLHLDHADEGLESPEASRQRLRDAFPRGATRRMTQLGLLVGHALDQVQPAGPITSVVYASSFAETRASESYLDSFPTPSPTLFQTSIHPSAVQQRLIGRQQPVARFFPHTGGENLVESALLTALLEPDGSTLFCGGEERGTWLLECGHASPRTFAFALRLSCDPADALARISLTPDVGAPDPTPLPLATFFDHLRHRQPLDRMGVNGLRLRLTWL